MRFFLLALLFVCWLQFSSQSQLLSSDQLTDSCFDFPNTDFGINNCVKCTYGNSPHFVLATGSPAIDFSIPNVDGELITLSTLLEEKPVILIWGMHTCPAFEGLGTSYPFDQCSYEDEWDLVEEYQDSFTFVHLVGPEPHPQSPYVNFDSGKIKTNYWSTVPQAFDWSTRRSYAQKIESKIHPSAHLLVDLLPGDPHNMDMSNPVWCSYGPGARTVMLIDQDGIIQYERTWLRIENLVEAMGEL
jgi:hypothetical protein